MLHRLAAKEEARLQISSSRRAGSVASVDPDESTARFLLSFADACKRWEESLSSLHSPVQGEAVGVKDSLDLLAVRLSELERYVAEKAYFLPAYEVRSSQAAISSLREKLDAATAQLLPKKKFSFKGKASKAHKSIDEVREDVAPPQVSGAANVSEAKEEGNGASTEEKSKASEQDSDADASCRIRGIRSSIIVRDLKHQNAEEIMLENLTDCKVFLKGICRALYMHNLKSCEVYSGPITSSALIEEVENCVLMLASHQIRIHQTKRTDLYLRVRSRPIVEYTREVRVAPYAFTYEGIKEDLIEASLQEETGLWQSVDDFRWLRAIPSPNWSILPEVDRLPLVDGTSVVDGEIIPCLKSS
jgi:hypothetical protein